uniref:Uncharacterized protein n=1 Tax=Salix viminalis TaxID=40686 RepID=A0A6N2KC44_SALVM
MEDHSTGEIGSEESKSVRKTRMSPVIYPDALPFPYLKEILVDDCPNLRKLPLNSNSAKEHRIVIQGWEDWWRRLEWEDEAAQHTFLPSFKGCL